MVSSPESLLNDIAKLTLDGLRQSGFSIVSHGILRDIDNNEIRVMLNEAWQLFWKSKPEDFRSWEEERVATLRAVLR